MTPRNRRLLLFLLIVGAALLVGACAAGGNPAVGTANEDGNTAGFLLGLWHGIISPITFVIGLFADDVNVYEVHNSGNWYNFGFILGAVFLIGGPRAARRKKR
jgi:hypothetical protein